MSNFFHKIFETSVSSMLKDLKETWIKTKINKKKMKSEKLEYQSDRNYKSKHNSGAENNN